MYILGLSFGEKTQMPFLVICVAQSFLTLILSAIFTYNTNVYIVSLSGVVQCDHFHNCCRELYVYIYPPVVCHHILLIQLITILELIWFFLFITSQ
jgi:hypothetical protein